MIRGRTCEQSVSQRPFSAFASGFKLFCGRTCTWSILYCQFYASASRIMGIPFTFVDALARRMCHSTLFLHLRPVIACVHIVSVQEMALRRCRRARRQEKTAQSKTVEQSIVSDQRKFAGENIDSIIRFNPLCRVRQTEYYGFVPFAISWYRELPLYSLWWYQPCKNDGVGTTISAAARICGTKKWR